MCRLSSFDSGTKTGSHTALIFLFESLVDLDKQLTKYFVVKLQVKQDYRSYQRRSPSRERRRSQSLERRRHKDFSRSSPTREKSQKMHHRRHRSHSSSEERTSQPHKDNKKSHRYEEPRTYSRSKERGRYK